MIPYCIVIPTHKRVDLLRRTLRSLAECDLPDGHVGTLVVENGGQFGAREISEEMPAVLKCRYLFSPPGNKSLALNLALDDADCDQNPLLIFFDDDVRLERETIRSYIDAASRHRDVFFGGPIECDYERAPHDWIRLPPSAKGWTLGSEECSVDKPVFLGFNWAAFADDIRSVGGFDERFGPGSTTGARGQELTMMQRLLEHGLTGHFVPRARVYHYVPAERCSIRWSLNRIYQNGITWGLKSKPDSSATFRGYPRWMVRSAIKQWCAAAFRQVVKGRKESYPLWGDYFFFRGRMEGLKRLRDSA